MTKRGGRDRFKLVPERDNAETRSHEMFTEVGRTIVLLSSIENELANIYYSLLGHRIHSTREAMAPFYAQPWFEGKVLLVDLLMRLEAPQTGLRQWNNVVKELKQHRGLRNLVAHQRLYVGFSDKEGRVEVSLDPGELNLRYDKKRKRLSRPRDARSRSLKCALRPVR
jgi:hypothetical protein